MDGMVLEPQEPSYIPDCPRESFEDRHRVLDISHYGPNGVVHKAHCLKCGKDALWTPKTGWEWKERDES